MRNRIADLLAAQHSHTPLTARTIARRRSGPLATAVAFTAAAMIAIFSGPAASAAVYYWSQNSVATQTWTTAGNWDATDGVFATGSGNGLTFFMNTTAALVNGTNAITGSVPAALTMNSLTLNGKGAAATAASVINIASSSSTWTLDGTTPAVNLNGMNGAQALNYNVAANLTLAQANTTFTGDGTAGFTFSGLISGVSKAITKSGTSTLTLSNTGNTFSGGLTINASSGTVIANTISETSKTGLGTGAVSIGAGSTLNFLSANTTTSIAAINNTFTGTGLLKLTFTDTATGGHSMSGLGGFTGTIELANTTASNKDKLSGAITASSAALIIDSGSTLYVNGTQTFGSISVTGSGSAENRGAIRLAAYTLTGPITLAGSTTIGTEGGTVADTITSGASGTQTLTLGTSGSTTGLFNGAIGGGTGTIALTNVAGTNTLAGVNSYTGGTTVNGGNLVFSTTAAIPTTGSITINSGGAVNASGAYTTVQGWINSGKIVTTSAGAVAITANNSESLNFSTNGYNSLYLGSSGNYTYSGTLTPSANGYLLGGSGGTLTVSSNLTSSASNLTVSGAGTVVLSGNNTYTGATTLTNGTLSVGATANLGGGASNLVFNGGTLQVTGTTLTSFSGIGHTVSFNATKLVGLDIKDASNTFTVDQVLNQTSGGFTKSGAGTAILTQANTYTGTTTVNGGTLTINNGGSINPATGASLTIGTSTPTTFQYDSSAASNFGQIFVANGAGSSGSTLNQTAGTITGTLLSLNNPYTGQSRGEVVLSGGTMTINTGAVTLSVQVAGDNPPGTFTISNAVLNANGGLKLTGLPSINRNASGQFIQTSGTVNVSGGLTLVQGTSGNTSIRRGQYDLNGGTLNVNTITSTSTGASDAVATFNFNGGTLKPTASSTTFWANNANTTANVQDGGAIIDTNGFDITIAQPLLHFATATTDFLTKSGTGTLTLSGANTYTGTTVISAGTLQFTKMTSLYNDVTGSWTAANINVKSGATIALNVDAVGTAGFDSSNLNTLLTNISVADSATAGLQSGASIAFDTTTATGGAFTQGNLIANSTGANGGAIGVTKLGTGTLVLDKANAYTGPTSITGGILQLSGGDNRLLSTGTVSFTGGNGSAATLDIGANSQTLASITIPTTLMADSSMTGTIKGSGGTLTVNGAADLNLGPTLGGTARITGLTTIDMSNLANFVYNAPSNTFRVGLVSGAINFATNADQYSILTMAGTSNTITAATFAIGDQGGSSGGGISMVHLGTTNILNVGNISTGTSDRSSVYLDFASGLTSPTLTIRNTDGTSAVTSWTVGTANTFGSAAANQATWTQSVDLSAGTVDANVTTLTIGKAYIGASTARIGTTNASFTVGATNHGGADFTVGTLNLGLINGTSTTGVSNTNTVKTLAANGTFTLNNANGVLSATTITFATNTLADTQTGNTKTVSGTFNLTDGTLNATTIQKGAQTGTATATTAFNWGTGTIANIAADNLTWTNIPITLLSGTHTFNATSGQMISLDASSVIADSGSGYGITKAGAGTLILSGANTYTGGTIINLGTLQADNSSALGSSGDITFGGGTLQYTTNSKTVNYGSRIKSNSAIKLDFNGQNITALTGIDSSNTSGLVLSNSGAGTAGTVTLSAANSYTGGTTVGDKVRVNLTNNSGLSSGAVTVNNGGQVYLNTGATNVTNSFTLNGAGWVGDPTVIGALRMNNGSNIGSSSTITLATASTIYADNGKLATIDGKITGGGNLTVNASGNGGTLVLTNSSNDYSGTTTIIWGALQIGNGTDAGSIAASSSITNNSALVYNVGAGARTYSNIISGTGTLTQNSSGGTLTLSGANTYTGATTVNAGTLTIGTIAANGTAQPLGQGTSAILLGSASSGTLEYIGASAANLGRDVTVNSAGGGIIKNSGGGLLTLSGMLTKNGTVLTLKDGMFAVTGKVTGASANSDLVIDNATVTLTNASNDYNGPTIIQNSGKVVVAADYLGAVPGAATVGNLVLNNGTLNAADSFTLASNRGLAVGPASGSGNGTIEVDSGKTLDYAGIIANLGSGTGSLLKTGSGTLNLAGSNSYSGNTTINAGTLNLVSGAVIASGTTTVASGAALVANGTVAGQTTVTGTLTGTGSLANLTINSGGNFSPGSVGTAGNLITTGTMSWKGGGFYTWDVTTVADSVANDRLTVGSLDLSALASTDSTTRFNIIINSLSLGDWESTKTHTWTLATGSSPISMPVSYTTVRSLFTVVDPAGLGGSLWQPFYITAIGNSLMLNYIPEPGTLGLLAFGALALLGKRNRPSSRRGRGN